jgi:ribokinase
MEHGRESRGGGEDEGLPNIAVVGSANVDLVARTHRLPRPGETVIGEGFVIVPGGKGANQAVACAKLGVPTRFVGRVGRDPFGDLLVATLIAARVGIDGVARDADAPSGVAMIMVDGEGHNTILVASGANGRLTVEDVNAAAGLLAADAVLLQLEIPVAAVERAAAIARARGARVILNPAPARELPRSLLGLADVLNPNQSELELLAGVRVAGVGDAERAARVLIGLGVPAVVVTLGAAGALVVADDGAWHLPGYKVDVVDTTGAGDAFNGGLAVGLVDGLGLCDAARFANAAGALATTALGAQEALPTRARVAGLLGGSIGRVG